MPKLSPTEIRFIKAKAKWRKAAIHLEKLQVQYEKAEAKFEKAKVKWKELESQLHTEMVNAGFRIKKG